MDIIASVNPSIICLQEVIQDSDELTMLVRGKGYQASVSLGPNNKPGIAILYKTGTVTTLLAGQIMRIITEQMTVYNVYGPSGNQNQEARRDFFGTSLLGLLQQEDKLPILIGDWNCIIRRQDVESNPQRKLSPELKQLIEIYKYVDCHIKVHGQDISYTFQRQYMAPSRLDRAYIPEQWAEKVQDCEHIPSLSDHKALAITIDATSPLPKREARCTYWKLNTKILDHESFMDTFEKFWQKEMDQKPTEQSWADWWEIRFKPSVQKLLKSLSKERAAFRKSTRSYLYQALNKACQTGEWKTAHELKARLHKMMLDDLEGIVVRSGGKEWIDSEKGSVYHLSRETKNAKTGNLERLKINGAEISDPELIEEEVIKFFKALFNGHHRSVDGQTQPVDTGQPFQPDMTHLEEFMGELPTISPEDRAVLEAPITMAEITKALKTSPKHRAPGLDGLPHEFYQKTQHIIGPTLIKVFQEQLDRGELIPSGKEGVTRLIPKVEGTPTIQQVRPITLLSCDYKLMSKIIATRMNKILPRVLTSSQLCTRKPRTILTGVTELISVMEHVKVKNLSAYLLSLDAYKAFDKANTNLSLIILERMGFGPTFTGWIKAMHKDVGTRFILGEMSERLALPLSLRQGDNVAMPLFLLNMEPLLLRLKKNLKGIQVGPAEVKDQAYVDDIQIISSDTEDLHTADRICKEFEEISGMVLSREKTKILGLGGWEGRQVWPLPWAKPVDSMTAFGVTFRATLEDTTTSSWNACLKGIRSCMHGWGSRSISTLKQRVFISSTYGLSKLWYLAQVLQAPDKIIEEVEKICRQYLWRGRLEHLPWEELMANRDEGGLGIPHIKSKCDTLFLRNLNKGLQDETTRLHLSYWLGISLRNTLPDLRGGRSAETLTPYFRHAVNLIKEGFGYGLTERAKSRQIYKCFTSTPPVPRILTSRNLAWELVFRRCWDRTLTAEQQDIMYTVISNIYTTKERLHRLNQHPTGNCGPCREPETREHAFLHCPRFRDIWTYLMAEYPNTLTSRIRGGIDDNWILLSYQHQMKDKEKTFLIAVAMEFIHLKRKEESTNNTNININTVNQFKGHLQACIHHHQAKNIQL